MRTGDTYEQILDHNTILKGDHNRINLLCAGLALYLYGIDTKIIRSSLSEFKGIEHRLELFLNHNGVHYYNDSAATIPQATVAAIQTLRSPVFLITGGTDKNIDFSPLLAVITQCEKVYLIAGTGTEKIVTLLNKNSVTFEGPFSDLNNLVDQVISDIYTYKQYNRISTNVNYSGVSVLFSPGCASFGMFLNEFDRGRKFKECVTQRLSVPFG